MSYYGYPKYVSVAEKKAKAEKKLKQLKKKNPGITPVTITGRTLARSWWGKAWNENLERYADFAYRLERGRSYVRHGAVLDLKVTSSKVTALVQGSGRTPYEVTVKVVPMMISKWQALKAGAVGTMDSVQAFMAGRLPEAMADLLTEKGKGLFPSPNEISFACSCPDSASMCKHVAASLYGVGARLDEDPSLLFLLRKVSVQDLITETVTETRGEMLSKAKKRTGRVMEDVGGLSDLFGIDLGGGDLEPSSPKRTAKGRQKTGKAPVKKNTPVKGVGKKKTVAKPKVAAKKGVEKKKNTPMGIAPKRIAPKKKEAPSTAAATLNEPMTQISALLKKKRKGMPVADVISRSGMDPQKVRNTLYQMKQKGLVDSPSRGVYRWVDPGS